MKNYKLHFLNRTLAIKAAGESAVLILSSYHWKFTKLSEVKTDLIQR